tara:strand:+ start:355 stop:1059 length:705 start_codon:yes stop_codon:yes gene_type:complete
MSYKPRRYGSYYDTTTQTNIGGATGYNTVKLASTTEQSGLTIAKGTIAFTSGGTTVIAGGNTITGNTSGAIATVNAVSELFSGSWAGGDAVGLLYITITSGVFQLNEVLLVAAVDSATAGAVPINDTIIFPATGVYTLQFSLQTNKTDPGADDMEVALAVNGALVANSASRETLDAANEETILTVIYTETFTAADRVQIVWHSDDTAWQMINLAAGTTPTFPAAPSAIATVWQI